MFFTLSFCQIVKVPSIFLYLETQNRHFLKQTQIILKIISLEKLLTVTSLTQFSPTKNFCVLRSPRVLNTSHVDTEI